MHLALDLSITLLSELLALLAAASLGLLSGALLAEDRLLLPYWRMLPAERFYELHPIVGPQLYRFFAPLTMAAPLATLLAVVQSVVQYGPLACRSLTAVAAAVLTFALVAIYLMFFKAANAAFERRAVPAAELPVALARWAVWHRFRVIVCLVAFGLSLVTLAV